MSVPIKVVLLGSGSTYPNPTRYHPSLAIVYEGDNLLFDCGEAVQIRLQQAGISPMKIDSIFITHLHGDHFFGLPGIVYSMALQGRTKPLTIYGPKNIASLKVIMELGYHQVNFPVNFVEVKAGTVLEGEDWVVEAIEVEHGIPALAYRFMEKNKLKVLKSKIKGLNVGPWLKKIIDGETVSIGGKKIGPEILKKIDGRRIVYSGDCMPSNSLVKFAEGADLLFHEATYSGEDVELAKERFHSTSRQAAEIAKRSRVKKLIIFHYSRRYKDTTEMLAEARKIFSNTVAGKDLMVIKL